MSRRPTKSQSVTKCTPATARQMAFCVLDEHYRTHAMISPLIDRIAENAAHTQRPLLMELTNGIVRRRATLNSLIKSHLTRRRDQVEGRLWTLLQLGIYQLVFLSSIPAHAAIHETVELTKWMKQPRWSAFVNGVLRSAQRSLTNEFDSEPRSDAVPITNGKFRQFTGEVFPNPETAFADFFATAFSFPRWLSNRWNGRYQRDELIRMGFHFNDTPTTYLRVNSLKTIREDLLGRLAESKITAKSGGIDESIVLESTAALTNLPEFANGLFTIQDESAMAASRLLNPQPGETILDLCAAPGTKTTHIAELMKNQGAIVATDVSGQRLSAVRDNCRRLGLDIVETLLIDRDGTDIPRGPFDAILVDAPCSNTGVLGRRPEVRWRIELKDIVELAEIQSRLLDAAASRLKPSGRIVYSTCSIEPDECREVVRSLLSRNSRLSLAEELFHKPGNKADGGYQALITASALSRSREPSGTDDS